MAKILAFEISDQPGSLALHCDGQLVEERFLDADQKTTRSFAVAAKAILDDHSCSPNDIDVVAVCDGPGSFTGLRIGVTWAKCFCYSTGAKAVAVNTLEVLARQAAIPDRPLWSVLNAYRKQLFVRQTLGLQEIVSTEIVGQQEFSTKMSERDVVIGTGVAKIKDRLPSGTEVLDSELWVPRASTLAQIAAAADTSTFADYWKLSPKYYRMSAAEEKLLDAEGTSDHPSSKS